MPSQFQQQKIFNKLSVTSKLFDIILVVVCTFSCPGNGLFPDPSNCGYYYNCWSGKGHRYACPKGTVFNPKQQYCDWPYNYKCEGNHPFL